MKKLETIGTRFKKARIKSGFTFDDIYKSIKVHPHILEALEEDKIDYGIGEVYMRGFLKKYAKFLGFQSDKILSEFSNNANVLPEEPRERNFISIDMEKDTPPLIIKDRFKSSMLPLVAVFGLLFILSIIGYAGSRFVKEIKKFRPASATRPLSEDVKSLFPPK